MAYLSKKAYDGKADYAGKRNYKNRQIAIDNDLNDETCDLLSELCQLRHDVHCNHNSIWNVESGYNGYDNLLKVINKINDLDIFPALYITSPEDLPCSLDYDLLDDDEQEEYDEWEEQNKLSDMLEEVNTNIENFLRKIDEKYGTEYCPTGIARMKGIM